MTLAISLVELSGERGYLPIAAAYLAAFAEADPAVRDHVDVSLTIEHTQTPVDLVFDAVMANGVPDVLGLSCQGWAIPHADVIARRVREVNPDSTIVFGGNHVSHGGDAFFASRPFADVLVNGEGERPFRDVLASRIEGSSLEGVAGVTFRTSAGAIVANQDRARITDLDEIPSPYLSGILDPHLPGCTTALLETNRGCPYRCSYCYWGGAIGQKLQQFSLDRLRAEMALLAERNIDSWYICDANFGILPRDVELVEEIVRLHEEYDYPRTVHTNWAKNANRRIVEMCARLNNAGIHSTYSIALQSNTKDALVTARRANMRINDIAEVSALCHTHRIVPRGELIWGLPGESYREFLASYDTLAAHTDALSVYPLYVLPNTGYERDAAELEIHTEAIEPDTDYAYCVQHRQMSRSEFVEGMQFVVSNNILRVGSTFLRVFPRAAAQVGIPSHETVAGLRDWVQDTSHPAARRFKKFYADPLATHRQSLNETWFAIARDTDALLDMFCCYIEEALLTQVASHDVAALSAALEYDRATFPTFDSRALERAESVNGTYRRSLTLTHDVLAFDVDGGWPVAEGEFSYTIDLPSGLWRYPIGNWYFGLLGFRGRATSAHPATLVPTQDIH
jgi:radical SAM C-methyltransferase